MSEDEKKLSPEDKKNAAEAERAEEKASEKRKANKQKLKEIFQNVPKNLDAQNEGDESAKNKMSNRRAARIIAVEMLFAITFTKYSVPQTIDMFESLADEETLRPQISKFTIDLVTQTVDNLETIDETLKRIIKNWKPERLSIIDRTLLRLGAAEVTFFVDIPPKVTINEYIEIAKDYSENDAPGFINGILDRLARNCSKL
jgi:transcription antitermination protein NusB